MTFKPDEQRILENTNLASLRYLQSIDSTNNAAKSLPEIKLPALLIAGEQLAGRGQQTNTWWSDSDSLACSWIAQSDSAIADNMTSLAAAVATANAIEQTASGITTKVKWPNDIFVNNAKVAGILVESDVRNNATRIIVGIGINSNCQMKNAPAEIKKRSTSLLDVLNQKIDQDALIISLVSQLESKIQELTDDPASILERFRTLSLLEIGKMIRVATRNGELHSGIFKGVGSYGELIIEQNDSDRNFFSVTIEEY